MDFKIKKVNMDNLPLYEMKVTDDDSTGVFLISLVDEPAIEVMGVAFNKNNNVSFKKVPDQQIIVGPAMIPDMHIYRENTIFGPHNTFFTKETICKIVEKFNRSGDNRRINIDHEDRMVNGFILEDWIIEDSTYDKSKKYGFNLPVGTWMIKVKIDDTDFWNTEVKGNGKFGFSIEGMIDQQLVSFNQEYTIDDLDLHDLLEIFDMKDNYVTPEGSETEEEFMGRCIPYMIDEGYPQDQSIAICRSKWESK